MAGVGVEQREPGGAAALGGRIAEGAGDGVEVAAVVFEVGDRAVLDDP